MIDDCTIKFPDYISTDTFYASTEIRKFLTNDLLIMTPGHPGNSFQFDCCHHSTAKYIYQISSELQFFTFDYCLLISDVLNNYLTNHSFDEITNICDTARGKTQPTLDKKQQTIYIICNPQLEGSQQNKQQQELASF